MSYHLERQAKIRFHRWILNDVVVDRVMMVILVVVVIERMGVIVQESRGGETGEAGPMRCG